MAGLGLANFLSRRSRAKTGTTEEVFFGEEREWLILYCKEVLEKEKFDFFVFGHRHLPIDFRLNDTSRYINLGDWITFFTYAVFDQGSLTLKSYKDNEHKIIRKE
jgi:UDP-2,3-diacylglucosamine hydrolase